MMNSDIIPQRLRNQGLVNSKWNSSKDIVKGLGAVQAQEYANAKWSLGLRLHGSTNEDIEKAFSEGKILRTHVMRPTWHFLAAEDIRWMLALTAPRVNAVIGHYFRKIGLNEQSFLKSRSIFEKELSGNRQFTRDEMRDILEKAGMNVKDLKFSFLLAKAELDGVICSGARRGKHMTYALLEERAKKTKPVSRDTALAELVKRYFTSHGPATLHDFSWWSGLTIADGKKGLEMLKSAIKSEEMNGKTYWFSKEIQKKMRESSSHEPEAFLLPVYDEYIISYKDRSEYSYEHAKIPLATWIGGSNPVVIDGKIAGIWKRTIKEREILLRIKLYTSLNNAGQEALSSQIEKYSEFWGLPVKRI